MPTFIFAYRIHKDYVPGNPEAMSEWASWFQSIGDNLIDRGNPVFESTELGDCGEQTRIGGYTFVKADDLESAVAIAKGSPALNAGGGVEVGTVTVLDLGSSS